MGEHGPGFDQVAGSMTHPSFDAGIGGDDVTCTIVRNRRAHEYDARLLRNRRA